LSYHLIIPSSDYHSLDASRFPITKARINLGAVVRRVHLNKECFILEKDGIPVAGLMNVDDFEDWLELHDPEVRKQIAEGWAEYQRGETRPLDEFLAEMRQEQAEKAGKK
jgi:PHD/YefM family antitoxin component YafN of YafNO toxin-antitoxin module